MTKQVLLTDEGLKNLEAELDELKTVKRKEIAEKIKVALSFGDLSENSEYDEAKNEQAIVEALLKTRLKMLKSLMKMNFLPRLFMLDLRLKSGTLALMTFAITRSSVIVRPILLMVVFRMNRLSGRLLLGTESATLLKSRPRLESLRLRF